jgi:hypothetical protein
VPILWQTILNPKRGRKVSEASILTWASGATSKRNHHAIVASNSTASIIANNAPMHFRGPSPKGKYAERGSSER